MQDILTVHRDNEIYLCQLEGEFFSRRGVDIDFQPLRLTTVAFIKKETYVKLLKAQYCTPRIEDAYPQVGDTCSYTAHIEPYTPHSKKQFLRTSFSFSFC